MKLWERKKKTETSTFDTPVTSGSEELRGLAGGDEEMYQALSRLMFLDPIKVKLPLETFVTEAQSFESKGDRLRAEVDYRIAGSLALYKGDAEGIRAYFSKALALSNNSRQDYAILIKNAPKAIELARKFYENATQFKAPERSE